MKFLGFRRPDGEVGIRNHVLVLATVGCAAEAARQTADGIYGAVSFINQNGCGESSRNLRRTQDVLVGMAANPNVYGVVAIGLGCEMNRMDGFIKELRARTDKPIEGLLIQEEGGTLKTIEKAVRAARELAAEAGRQQKELFDISELFLGIECGGSDESFTLAWQCARPNAIVTVVALYDRAQSLPLPDMYGKNLTFKTGGVDACGLDEVMGLIAAGKLDTSLLISRRYPLNDILEAYRAFEAREDGCLKVVITPWEKLGR